MKKNLLLILSLAMLAVMPSAPLKAETMKKANLTCFVRFADETNGGEEGMFVEHPFSYYEQLFNDKTAGKQSVYNYFLHSSYGQLEWTTSFFPAPDGDQILSYQAQMPRGYYQEKSSINPDGWEDATMMAARERGLIREIVGYVNEHIDKTVVVDADNDGRMDNLTIVVSSCSELGSRHMLWPHRSDLLQGTEELTINGAKVVGYLLVFDEVRARLTAPTTLGVICHETSHSLGTYDLYHVNDDLNPVGAWDLMSDNQDVPQQMTVYTKYRYCKWVDEIPEISKPGVYTLNPVGGTTKEKIAYKVKPVGNDEYFVLEYRKKEGYDSSIPSSGLLVYRINPKVSGGNVGYNGTTRLDEEYIFRPGGSLTSDGNITNAAFSSESGRTAFGGLAEEKPFYSNGTIANFAIANVSTCGETLSFELLEMTKQLILSADSLVLKGAKESGATMTIAADDSWTITGVPEWLAVTPTEGAGGSTEIALTAKEDNTTGGVLKATLTVTSDHDASLSKTFVVMQEPKASNVILFDDFENTANPNEWVIDYEGEEGRGWQYTEGSTTGKLTNMTYSGTHAMTMKDSYWEDKHMDAKLTSKTFANGTQLSFYSHCNGGNSTPKTPPVYIIEVSSDNGATWNTVFDVLKDYPRDEEGNTVKVLFYTKITIDISAYKSETMKIRFNCYDTNQTGLQYWWQIDDLEITGETVPTAITTAAVSSDKTRYYNLQGRMTIAPQRPGIYVVRTAEGCRKVVVK